jgi:hypothetical protein
LPSRFLYIDSKGRESVYLVDQQRIDRLEKVVDNHEYRIGRLEQSQAAGAVEFAAIKTDIEDIREGQKWATRYALGTLVTVILAILGFWSKFA